jgi:hypothetical protein
LAIAPSAGGTANCDDVRLQRSQSFDRPDVDSARQRQETPSFPEPIGHIVPDGMEGGWS